MGWGTGETLIAAATLLWSVEVIVAKRLLVGVSAPLLGGCPDGPRRAAPPRLPRLTGRLAGLGSISGEAWLWILVTGVLLAGYVATWFAALRETQATTVTSVLVLAAVVTGALSAAAKGSAPDPAVLAGYLLIVAGVVLVSVVATGFVGRSRAARAVADA